MKKICIFCGFYPIVKGGAEYQSKLIGEKFSQYGYEVFYISFGHDIDKVITLDGFRIYCFRNPSKIDSLTLYELVGSKILNVMVKENPQIIYQRILNSYTPHLAKIAFKMDLKLSIHIADNYSLTFGADLRSRIRRHFFERIKKYISKGARINFIAQTCWQKEHLLMLGCKASLQIYNMHPVPTNEDFNIIDSAELDFLRNGNLNVFWIGNVRPVKRLDIALELALELAPKNINFIFIGRLSSCPSSLSLKEVNTRNIYYLGERDNDFINSNLLFADFLLNTSDSEGFSNTFIQAWIRGVPVLSLNSDPDGIIEKYGLGMHARGEIEILKNCIENGIPNIKNLKESSNLRKDISRNLFGLDHNFEKLIHEVDC